MATTTELITPAVVKMVAEMRRVVEAQVKTDLARRWDRDGMSAENIAKLLGVSRGSAYRYLERSGENGPQGDTSRDDGAEEAVSP